MNQFITKEIKLLNGMVKRSMGKLLTKHPLERNESSWMIQLTFYSNERLWFLSTFETLEPTFSSWTAKANFYGHQQELKKTFKPFLSVLGKKAS